jgi:RNA-binding protein YlmH
MSKFHCKTTDSVQLLQAHWTDLAERADRDSRPYFTDFVPVEDFSLAEPIAKRAGVQCVPFGGTEETQRVMLCFAPEWLPVESEHFPLTCITLSYPKSKELTHRDFLGAFLACNIERDTIGDILISGGMAQAFVCSHVAPILLQELTQIGSVGVQVTQDLPVTLSAGATFLTLCGTVASLRVDALTAFVTRLSREKASQLIRQGKVICRHTAIDTPSALMQSGDVFSIRGYGKFRLNSIDGITRKGRYHITIYQYQGTSKK